MGSALELINLSQRSQAQSPHLFKNISLRWEAPAFHVIMGHSGSGKSSLLKNMAGVWRPQSGEVLLDGQKLWKKMQQQNMELTQRIGFAFQNNALFSSMRVLENLCYPHLKRFPDFHPAERKDLACEWLEKVGLAEAAHLFPHELSGGMQKRLAIARALILRPNFLFLDDPTAGLDPITSRHMGELLGKLLENSSALITIVTNDADRARHWGPNIHFLHSQRLVSRQDSTYEEIKREFL